MAELVSKQCRLLIQVLLTDSKVQERVFDNAKDVSKYKICDIREDGTIILGKTSVRWWNQLLNCQDKLTFEAFALKVWDVLVDQSSGINNEAILKGLSQEIILNSVRNKDYNYVVHRLYDCWTHVAQKSEGYQQPAFPAGNSVVGDQGSSHVIQVPVERPLSINVNVNGKHHVIPFQDSIGDTMNLGLEFGITGVKKLY